MITKIPVMRIPTFAAPIVVHCALVTAGRDIFINRPYLSTVSFNVVVSTPVLYVVVTQPFMVSILILILGNIAVLTPEIDQGLSSFSG